MRGQLVEEVEQIISARTSVGDHESHRWVAEAVVDAVLDTPREAVPIKQYMRLSSALRHIEAIRCSYFHPCNASDIAYRALNEAGEVV